MISRAEFDRHLQAGHIAQALALLLSEANAIDITTEITDEINTNVSDSLSDITTAAGLPKSEYLRTKIDLLTGEIHNQVGKDLIVNSSSYLKLQQLHIDQIVASYRIVQEHLRQISGILAAVDSNPQLDPITDRFDLADTLPTRLTETFRAILTSTAGAAKNLNIDRHTNPQSTTQNEHSADLAFDRLPQPSQPIVSHDAFDDDIDLSLDETTVEWEEWAEDENVDDEKIESKSAIQSSASALQAVKIPAWGEDWVRPHPQKTAIKPIKPRTKTGSSSIDPSEQWDKFRPEHVGIYVDSKPNSSNPNDPYQVDKLLADLDNLIPLVGDRSTTVRIRQTQSIKSDHTYIE
jgi:hypothetical protein